MATSTNLFLAYMNHKAGPNPRLSFAEYVATKPDLAALILVSMLADELGIPRRAPRKARSKSNRSV
jgi:hypothetical protein